MEDKNIMKFRSSANFVNMKYFKHKAAGEEIHDNDDEKTEQETTQSSDNIHPPLPLDPPPLDTFQEVELSVKQEVEDYEEGEDHKENLNVDLLTEFKKDTNCEESTEKKTVCRDFLRGNCSRPDCKYAHEFDMSQLPSVYTFCRNFQNSKCTLASCKYVHATVFEEQRFYRTGILPPHTLAHHKKSVNVMPPAPVQGNKESTAVVTFSNPPPTLTISGEILGASVPSQIVSPPQEKEFNQSMVHNITNKPQWLDSVADPPPYRMDKNAKKCSFCEATACRLQYHKKSFEQVLKTSQENARKLELLLKKNKELYTILHIILKQVISENSLNAITNPNANLMQKVKLFERLAAFLAKHSSVND